MTFRRASWPPELYVGDRVVIRVIRGEDDYFGTVVGFKPRTWIGGDDEQHHDGVILALVDVDKYDERREKIRSYHQSFLTRIDPV